MVHLCSSLILVACFLGSAWTETMTVFGEEYYMVADMLIPKDREKSLETDERSFIEGKKYPFVDGRPTVYYTFDPERAEIRDVTRQSLDILEQLTCFKFFEVPNDDKRSKLYYYKGSGCFSVLGYTQALNMRVSIGPGCNTIDIISHETMHAMGFPHSQQRPDRDDNIKVFYQFIDPKFAYAFNIEKKSLTYGTVYDFSSTMQYFNYFFKNSSSPTFITLDPSHERYVGNGTGMRYSEAVMVNTYYECFSILGANCTGPKCLNGGFILDNCTCLCPDNFTGSACETFAGPWFRPSDYDAKFNQPGVFVTYGYPFDNPKVDAINWFLLPKCYYPRVKVLENDIQSANYDFHGVRMDSSYIFNNLVNVGVGGTLNGELLEAVLQQNTKHVKPGRGAVVALDYIPDGKCTGNYADFSQIVCTKQRSPNNGWVYQTPKYPENTNEGMACLLLDEMDETKLQSFLVNFDYNLPTGERLEVKHGHKESITLVGPTSANITFASAYPTTFMYKASDLNPGYFSYKASAVTVPAVCGKTTAVTDKITVTQPFTSSFPGSQYPYGVMCNMLFQTTADKKLKISFKVSTPLKTSESLIVYTNYKNRDDQSYTVTQQTDEISISSSLMLVTYKYVGSPVFSNWEFTVTSV